MLRDLPVPFVFVSSKKLQDGLQKASNRNPNQESFTTICNHLLVRALLKAGSVSFIPQKVPIVDSTPTMIVGLIVKEFNQFSIVASLKQEFDSFYSNSAAIRKSSINRKK